MKLQEKIMKEQLKAYSKYFAFQLILIVTYIIFLKIAKIPITTTNYLIILGEKKNNIMGILFSMYQIILCLTITYQFYMYEIKNNNINVMMRVKSREWVVNKLHILIETVVIYKIIYSIVTYQFFINICRFPLKLIIYNISKSIIVALILINLINNYKNKRSIIVAILLLFVLTIYFNNLFINILFIIIIYLINIYTFTIKNNLNVK